MELTSSKYLRSINGSIKPFFIFLALVGLNIIFTKAEN